MWYTQIDIGISVASLSVLRSLGVGAGQLSNRELYMVSWLGFEGGNVVLVGDGIWNWWKA